jgi:ppGpp synthetase/RelA/SpoT-type nucleotidyltranferase
MQNFVHSYEVQAKDLASFLAPLKQRLEDLLVTNGIMIHSVIGRIKSPASFKKKFSRPDRTYADLWDITDLVGLRVITYFEDNIEPIGRLIEDEFEVDYLNSQNKLRLQDHEKFGYRSLHYVCRVPGHPHARFEIQIRTVLQHAWAEIEHDLGYKTNEEIPAALRRRFSQVAGLLEVADREFVALRSELASYEKSLMKFEDVSLDVISLRAFIETDDARRLDDVVAAYLQKSVTEEVFFADYLVRALRAAGITTSQGLRKAVEESRGEIAAFLVPYFEFTKKHWNLDPKSIEVQRGYGLLFVAHLRALKNATLHLDKVQALTDFYLKLDYPDRPEEAKLAARALSGLRTGPRE